MCVFQEDLVALSGLFLSFFLRSLFIYIFSWSCPSPYKKKNFVRLRKEGKHYRRRQYSAIKTVPLLLLPLTFSLVFRNIEACLTLSSLSNLSTSPLLPLCLSPPPLQTTRQATRTHFPRLQAAIGGESTAPVTYSFSILPHTASLSLSLPHASIALSSLYLFPSNAVLPFSIPVSFSYSFFLIVLFFLLLPYAPTSLSLCHVFSSSYNALPFSLSPLLSPIPFSPLSLFYQPFFLFPPFAPISSSLSHLFLSYAVLLFSLS